MANPVVINPTLTLAGQAAAFNASNNGLELKITHVSFGKAHYDPTGNEVALVDPVGSRVTVAGASRPTPYQIRMVSQWREDVGEVGIGEIGFWAEDVLVFVWSKADGTVASYKTDGVSYVLFNDLAFAQVPAGSVSFVVDPDESVALAALLAHEGADNAHPQYALRAKFPDYQGHLWGEVGGTADAITLTLPEIVELTSYIKGNRFTFKAAQTNTGATTINVDGVGAVEVLKTGGLPLTAGSIIAGGVYDVYYDGSKFQLTAGAGFASAEASDLELQQIESDSTSWVSARRFVRRLTAFAKLAGAAFTGDVTGVTPPQFDADKSFPTTEFLKRMGIEYGGYVNYSASASLDLSACGKLHAFGHATNAMEAQLPTGAIIATGATVTLLCTLGSLTVTAAVGDSIDAVNAPGSIALAQGDTAEFIRNGTMWRLVGGSVLLKYTSVMRGANWVTQPQFDNSKKLATTEFVKGALGSFNGVVTITNDTVLDASHIGKRLEVTNGAVLVTLPAASSVPIGSTLLITTSATTGVQLAVPAGGTVLAINNYAVATPYTMSPSGDVLLVNDGAAWRGHMGSECLRSSPLFGSSLGSANGYQKLPSGRIEQWGLINAEPNSTTTITLPMAFPNAFRVVIPAVQDNIAYVESDPIVTALPLGLGSFSLRSYYKASNIGVAWLAIGN